MVLYEILCGPLVIAILSFISPFFQNKITHFQYTSSVYIGIVNFLPQEHTDFHLRDCCFILKNILLNILDF